MANEYGTIAELKASLSIGDTSDDAALSLALETASRMIDDHTGRYFYLSPVSTVAYVVSFGSGYASLSLPDDIATLAGFALSGSSDLVGKELYLDGGSAAKPYTRLSTAPIGVGPYRVSAANTPNANLLYVTASFGWPAIPVQIRQAALIQASRLFSRRSSPFGVAGSAEMGSEMRLLSKLDPDVEILLKPFVKGWYVV